MTTTDNHTTPAMQPVRYTQDQHHIRLGKVSKEAIQVCTILQNNGFEAYIVGGAVRDMLLGHTPKDYDVVTNARPNQIKSLFRSAMIIGRRFKLVHIYFRNHIVETSTFRYSPSEKNINRQGRIVRDNVYGKTVEDDAQRRDLTINALYYNPTTQEVLDFYGGMEDIQHKVVRMIGDATQRYREDPVRMLRVLRFSSKLQLQIAPSTLAPIENLHNLLRDIPKGRLQDELYKALTCGHSLECLQLYRQHHVLSYILPIVSHLEKIHRTNFMWTMLERSDQRIQSGITLSINYMYATILWPIFAERLQALPLQDKIEVFEQLAFSVCQEYAERLLLTKNMITKIREIWLLQFQMVHCKESKVRSLLSNRSFRAAVELQCLRAEFGEVDQTLALWWREFADSNVPRRKSLVQTFPQLKQHL